MYLGLDLSTQQLKGLITDEDLKVVANYNVEFDVDLPHYNTVKGVFQHQNGEINSPVLMWIESLDLLLSRIVESGFNLDQIKGISGSCQQHGSVYWSKNSNLNNLDPSHNLINQLNDSFSCKTSPNWQDHSTSNEIRSFEKLIGNKENLAKITGSRAHYRFTGPQIRKLIKDNSQIYENTERITLISNFLSSLLIGKISNIDEADACGMNLYDIEKKNWNDELLSICTLTHAEEGIDEETRKEKVNELKLKLGQVCSIGYDSIGNISSYFVEKYNFNSSCKIFSFTGDNLATILSLPLNKDEILISLGTSTTVLLITKNYIPSSNYHLFIHPTIPDYYMGMICYCNGSLAREKIRDELNLKFNKPKNDWDMFNEILDHSKFNNNLGIYLPLSEIVPNKKSQIVRANFDDNRLKIIDNWEIENDVNSIIESQALSCRVRVSPMLSIKNNEINEDLRDLRFDDKLIKKESLSQKPNKIFYVGGSSRNLSIIKKFSEILGSMNGNFKFDNSNACAIGGCYKANWSLYCLNSNELIDYNEFLSKKFNWNSLQKINVEDKWNEYANGLVYLNQLENVLED